MPRSTSSNPIRHELGCLVLITKKFVPRCAVLNLHSTHVVMLLTYTTDAKEHAKFLFQVPTSNDDNVDLKELAYSRTSEELISLLSCQQ